MNEHNERTTDLDAFNKLMGGLGTFHERWKALEEQGQTLRSSQYQESRTESPGRTVTCYESVPLMLRYNSFAPNQRAKPGSGRKAHFSPNIYGFTTVAYSRAWVRDILGAVTEEIGRAPKWMSQGGDWASVEKPLRDIEHPWGLLDQAECDKHGLPCIRDAEGNPTDESLVWFRIGGWLQSIHEVAAVQKDRQSGTLKQVDMDSLVAGTLATVRCKMYLFWDAQRSVRRIVLRVNTPKGKVSPVLNALYIPRQGPFGDFGGGGGVSGEDSLYHDTPVAIEGLEEAAPAAAAPAQPQGIEEPAVGDINHAAEDNQDEFNDIPF